MSNSAQIRDAVAADLEFIHRLNTAEVPRVGEEPAAFFEHWLPRAWSLRIVEFDGHPAGFMLAMREDADYGSRNFLWFRQRFAEFAYVDRLAVADSVRRRGAGAALYRDLAVRSRAAGLPLIACEVNTRPRNQGSLDFHARLGFGPVGSLEHDGGAKAVNMLVMPLGAAP